MTLAQILGAALIAALWLSWYLAESREGLKREVQVLKGIRARQSGRRMPWEISSASYEWKVFIVAAPKYESVQVKLKTRGSGDGILIATVRVLDDDFDEQLANAQARGEDRAATLNAAVTS